MEVIVTLIIAIRLGFHTIGVDSFNSYIMKRTLGAPSEILKFYVRPVIKGNIIVLAVFRGCES